MKNEITITLIACAVLFTGISFLALETMNSSQIMTSDNTRQGDAPKDIVILKETPLIIEKYFVKELVKNPVTTIKKLDKQTSIKKTLTGFVVPTDNKMTWASIRGNVNNPAEGHPVIMKFFKSLDDVPVHIAQVDLKSDNTFEYKFRVLSIDDGITSHHFEGEYYIEIFKTVNTPQPSFHIQKIN